jgi:quercetin dioxygenase-like cupin family protein
MIVKEDFKYVEKVWGEEIILVNCEQYCAKLLIIDPKAEMSYHYHIKKTETFYCLEGYSTLRSDGRNYVMAPFTRPKTIPAGTKHMVIGHDEPCIILEVSTHHSDEDSVRETCSKAGY